MKPNNFYKSMIGKTILNYKIIEKSGEGLLAAHKKSIIHREIKSANII